MMEVNFKINIKQRIRRIICFTLIIFFAFLVSSGICRAKSGRGQSDGRYR